MRMTTDNGWITCREQLLKDTIPTLDRCLALALAVPEEVFWTFIYLPFQSFDDARRQWAVHRSARLLCVEKQFVALESIPLETGRVLHPKARMAQQQDHRSQLRTKTAPSLQ